MPDRRRKDTGPPEGYEERRSGVDRRQGPSDRRSVSRSWFQIERVIAIAVATAALLGYIYTNGANDSEIDHKLDRNCRILAVIQADDRYLIVEHANNQADAQALREIFKQAFTDTCG